MLIAFEEPGDAVRPDTLAAIDRVNAILQEMSGYTLSLRQLYYQHVAKGYIENTERSYKNLGELVTKGRMWGLIDWDAIEDRGRGVSAWTIEEDPAEVLRGVEFGLALDFWKRQGKYVEVWVEKDALSSLVGNVCEGFRVPYMACKGYLSASEAYRAGKRFAAAAEDDRDLILIHLGDHDPSGLDMTRDNTDRLQTFTQGTSIDVRRIALNIDQVRQYNPPPNPTKVTDNRAKPYIGMFGHDCWELDALSPRVIETLVRDEIRKLIDAPLWQATVEEENEARAPLAMLSDEWEQVEQFLKDL